MRSVAAILLISMTLFVVGCAPKFGEQVPVANKKVFDQEDQLIVTALLFDRYGEFNQSASLYQTLYEQSHKPEYLLERFKRLYKLHYYPLLKTEVQEYLQEAPNDPDLLRFYIATLNELKEFKKARKFAFKLLELTRKAQDYQRVASLYIQQEHYESAVKYLESAYNIAFDEEILRDLTTLMYYKLGRKKEAIAYLESHSRIQGCNEEICTHLAGFYADMDDTNGQISTYKRLYALTKKSIYAQSIIKAYAYNRETYKMVTFLEESSFDDKLLLRLYLTQKQYDKSIGLSSKLYKETKDPMFQAQYAISLYEASKEHTKKLINTVVENLKESVVASPDAIYLNYLGYLLIDHNVNVTEGIEYVNQALSLEENSAFYMDSLAWGYYKQGRCKDALKMINKAKTTLGKDDPEISRHYKKISNCKKGK